MVVDDNGLLPDVSTVANLDKSSFWFKHATRVVARPWLTIALVILCGLPLTIFSARLSVTSDANAVHPRSGVSPNTYTNTVGLLRLHSACALVCLFFDMI